VIDNRRSPLREWSQGQLGAAQRCGFAVRGPTHVKRLVQAWQCTIQLEHAPIVRVIVQVFAHHTKAVTEDHREFGRRGLKQ